MATRHLHEITAHIERHLGPIAFVFHEERSELVHVDVHCVAPTPEREWWTLVTSGMSDAPMHWRGCRSHPRLSYAELVMGLPADWPLARAREDSRWGWPVATLVDMARYPHARDTFLDVGHTFRSGHGRVHPSVPFTAALFLPPLTCDEAFARLQVGMRKIDFLGVNWLHPHEFQALRAQGLEGFLHQVDAEHLSEVLDPERAELLPRPRRAR